MTSFADRPGAVVLAAYRPDPKLFAVQLRSIRDQTLGSFRCLVGADGGQDEVRRLVVAAVGDDPRFEVVGWDDNVGLYLNVERLLGSLPADAAWVALADQDDRWYPDKLERLVPHLDEVALVSGQARVVTATGRVLAARTDRRVVAPGTLLLANQVSGSFSVLRREVLDTALPFPRLAVATQMHDHWLGLCAAVGAGYTVVDEPLQDYVQHGGNLVGEVERRHPRTPWGALRLLSRLAAGHAGRTGATRMVRAAAANGLGWRRLVAAELVTRRPGRRSDELAVAIGTAPRRSAAALLRAVGSGALPRPTALTLLAGLPGDVVGRGAIPLSSSGPIASAQQEVTPCTFVVVLHRTAPVDSLTLGTLTEALGPDHPHQVVVVDNGPDPDPEGARAVPGVDVVHAFPDNPGLAAAYGLAGEHARGLGHEWVVPLDQDTRITRAYLDALERTLSSPGLPTSVAVVAPVLVSGRRSLSPHGPVRLEARAWRTASLLPAAAGWHHYNSAAAVRLSSLDAVGGFPAEFPVDGLDHAVGARLRRAGFALQVLPVELEHHPSWREPRSVPPTRFAAILRTQERLALDGPRSEGAWLLVRRLLRVGLLLVGLRRTPSWSAELSGLARAGRVACGVR